MFRQQSQLPYYEYKVINGGVRFHMPNASVEANTYMSIMATQLLKVEKDPDIFYTVLRAALLRLVSMGVLVGRLEMTLDIKRMVALDMIQVGGLQ